MKASASRQVHLEPFLKGLYCFFIAPFVEIFLGLKSQQIPLVFCLSISSLAQLMTLVGFDFLLMKWMGLDFLYPTHPLLRNIYLVILSFSGFFSWGFLQVFLRIRLTQRLTEVFTNAGLKTTLNQLPSFVFDRPIDKWARKIRLRRNGLTQKQFEKAKEALESGLHIFIDDIKENRRTGSIDILYAHKQLENHVRYDLQDKIKKNSFIIGKTRSKTIITNLTEVPHFLIAGETGGGKSTFLRQCITTLYLHNEKYMFELIDLKGGLELQVFDNIKTTRIIDNASEAIRVLKRLNETYIEGRKKLFKSNRCHDIESFLSIPSSQRAYPEDQKFLFNVDRYICVIDEAFDLFMKGGKIQSQQAQEARTHANKIAAQGRALGVHLIIGTQRPDRNSLDPLTKANLPGKLCFSMANNISSMTILDSKRAADIPSTNKGRAIWKYGRDMVEVQTPFLSKEDTLKLLAPYKIKKQSQPLTSIKDSPPSGKKMPPLSTQSPQSESSYPTTYKEALKKREFL